ncbi:hypothetical protein B566_EDAN014748, partial [Ephemera danica]
MLSLPLGTVSLLSFTVSVLWVHLSLSLCFSLLHMMSLPLAFVSHCLSTKFAVAHCLSLHLFCSQSLSLPLEFVSVLWVSFYYLWCFCPSVCLCLMGLSHCLSLLLLVFLPLGFASLVHLLSLLRICCLSLSLPLGHLGLSLCCLLLSLCFSTAFGVSASWVCLSTTFAVSLPPLLSLTLYLPLGCVSLFLYTDISALCLLYVPLLYLLSLTVTASWDCLSAVLWVYLLLSLCFSLLLLVSLPLGFVSYCLSLLHLLSLTVCLSIPLQLSLALESVSASCVSLLYLLSLTVSAFWDCLSLLSYSTSCVSLTFSLLPLLL